jgi:ABC-type multidrug transport system ATPase subunit
VVTAAAVLLVTVLFLIGAEAAVQMKFFLLNNFFLYFFLFYLSGMGIIMMAFLLSVFIQKTKVAVPVGFAVFLVFFLLNMLATNIVYSSQITVPSFLRVLCMFFSPIVFAKGLNDLSAAATAEKGISWEDRDSYTDIYPLPTLYYWSAIDIAVYGALIWYFDNVIGGEHSVGAPFYFFLTRSYWTGKTQTKRNIAHKAAAATVRALPQEQQHPGQEQPDGEHRGHSVDEHPHERSSLMAWMDRRRGFRTDSEDLAAQKVFLEDEDVRAERLQVEQESSSGRDFAVKVLHAEKFFPNPGLCARGGYRAVRGVSFGVNRGELFALLGPNGAGKSTIQNMLIGVHGMTSGEAYIHEFLVGSDWDSIRQIIGVCPQHDVLWHELTAWEMLEIFAVLKGVPQDRVADEVRKRLQQVDLEEAAFVPAGTLSGGMQRRVSIAIAFVGDPKVVFLDEPTTGTDITVRRQIWDLIIEAKEGKTILLTTHSMEEADALADTIAIMGKGRIRCLGSSVRLKNKFGAGYKVTLIDETHHAAASIKDLVRNLIPFAELSAENGPMLIYHVPREHQAELPNVLEALEASPLLSSGDVDYSVSMASLEEVFIRISHDTREDEKRYQKETELLIAQARMQKKKVRRAK